MVASPIAAGTTKVEYQSGKDRGIPSMLRSPIFSITFLLIEFPMYFDESKYHPIQSLEYIDWIVSVTHPLGNTRTLNSSTGIFSIIQELRQLDCMADINIRRVRTIK